LNLRSIELGVLFPNEVASKKTNLEKRKRTGHSLQLHIFAVIAKKRWVNKKDGNKSTPQS
jgi:hypothetical protein